MTPLSDGDDDLPLDALLMKKNLVQPHNNENNNGNKLGNAEAGEVLIPLTDPDAGPPVIPYADPDANTQGKREAQQNEIFFQTFLSKYVIIIYTVSYIYKRQ